MIRLVKANHSLHVAERGKSLIQEVVFVRRDQGFSASASASGAPGNGWLTGVMKIQEGRYMQGYRIVVHLTFIFN